MTKQSLIVFNLPVLFNILNEIKENLNFDLYKFDKKNDLDQINDSLYGNFLILTNSTNNKNIADNILVIDNLPLKINEIIEKININLLKKKFNNQSEVKIDNFRLNINSRVISNNEKKIKKYIHLTKRQDAISCIFC